jgi:uncharacterized protein YbjT (DUF2867 family)
MNTRTAKNPIVLLTGATGYVGGLLLDRLLQEGLRVRCMVRRPEALSGRTNGCTEVIRGDVLDRSSLRNSLRGVDVAYYLVHSLNAKGSYADQDRIAARMFGEEALRAGVGRIVYLGGLGGGEDLSEHLASRQEVGRILRESGVPTVEFRASVVIGAGSLSFEMVRSLVERLPVMVIPRWVRTPAQPVAIDDVMSYLLAARVIPIDESRIYEIGGADRVSYLDLMKEYTRQRGLRRFFVPVPVLTPWLSSLWLKLFTPLLARVGRKLVDGVRNSTVVRDDAALDDFAIRPLSMQEAIARAIRDEPPSKIDDRSILVPCPPRQAFAPIRRIGGTNGWYFANWLWRVRGWIDRLVGGVGMRRGRRHPEILAEGDVLDFWRVESILQDDHLLLHAEMKLPGQARLRFEINLAESGAIIRQTARFEPKGLFGRLYWYTLLPFHKIIFRGMLKRIAVLACQEPETHVLRPRGNV